MRGNLWDEVREMVWVASVIGALSVLAVVLAVALASGAAGESTSSQAPASGLSGYGLASGPFALGGSVTSPDIVT